MEKKREQTDPEFYLTADIVAHWVVETRTGVAKCQGHDLEHQPSGAWHSILQDGGGSGSWSVRR